MIELKKVTKKFGSSYVLKGVDLTIPLGRIRVILGLSGSGKSVLLKHIIGLLKPDSGNILVEGRDITQLPAAELLKLRMQFGMVFQQAALFDSLTVFENVAFPLREHTLLKAAEIEAKVLQQLQAVNLQGVEHKYPAELSGGMKKRVGLARALILGPKYILYDEPTTGLDPLTADSVDKMICETAKAFKVTSVVISHDVSSSLKIADDIAVLHEGVIVADTTPLLLRQSKHPFVRKFLDTWFDKQ